MYFVRFTMPDGVCLLASERKSKTSPREECIHKQRDTPLGGVAVDERDDSERPIEVLTVQLEIWDQDSRDQLTF